MRKGPGGWQVPPARASSPPKFGCFMFGSFWRGGFWAGWLWVRLVGALGGLCVRCVLVGVRCAHRVGVCVRCAHVLDANWYVVVLLWRIQATSVLSVGG